jgi:hypothetical protein
MDVVYIVLRNSIDWSGPPPTFAGVGSNVAEALFSAGLDVDTAEKWIEEADREIRAYYSVIAYDMTTTPPTRMDRPDLKRDGGPVRTHP